jgi:hypothetical protein
MGKKMKKIKSIINVGCLFFLIGVDVYSQSQVPKNGVRLIIHMEVIELMEQRYISLLIKIWEVRVIILL